MSFIWRFADGPKVTQDFMLAGMYIREFSFPPFEIGFPQHLSARELQCIPQYSLIVVCASKAVSN